MHEILVLIEIKLAFHQDIEMVDNIDAIN